MGKHLPSDHMNPGRLATPGVHSSSEVPMDRRQKLVTLADGRIVDENAMRDYLLQLDRRNERVTVLRLSESDVACQAAAKGRRS
jgi:hypothetical protein